MFVISCKEKASCKTGTSACGKFEACCTTTDCYYNYNGKKYNCKGTNCEEAAKTLASVMCGTAINNSKLSLDAKEKQIIEQTEAILKAKAACTTCK